jgi:hypothetical protein
MKLRNLMIAGLGLAMAAGAAVTASADPYVANAQAHQAAAIRSSHHAVEVNRRLGWDVRHGRISRGQAYRIHHRLVAIRHHDRAVARHYSELSGRGLNHHEHGFHHHFRG